MLFHKTVFSKNTVLYGLETQKNTPPQKKNLIFWG